MPDEYADLVGDKTVYCRVCNHKIGTIARSEKYPPKEKRLCAKHQRYSRYKTGDEKQTTRRLRIERAKWDAERLADERAEREHQQVYVRCPRWVITRLLEAVSPEVEAEVAEEVKHMYEDPLPGDPKATLPTDWLRRKQGDL